MKNKNEILKHRDTTKARGRWPSLYDNQNQLSSVFFLNAMAVGITVGFAVLSFFRGIARWWKSGGESFYHLIQKTITYDLT